MADSKRLARSRAAGLRLAVTQLMNRVTDIPFESAEEERADEHDPTLAVDDLVDFLTARTDPGDPMLALTGLEEFFSARQNDDLETFVRKLEVVVVTEALLPCAALSDPGTPGDPEAPGDPGERGHREDDGECQDEFRSEIRRAAVEFQHFAETFHAFANECHHRRTN